MLWLTIPLLVWAIWLAWRWRNVYDPEDDGVALFDEWRWIKTSCKHLALALAALFVLRAGCYSCEASGEAGAQRAGESWKAATYESSAAFWRVWRVTIDNVLGI